MPGQVFRVDGGASLMATVLPLEMQMPQSQYQRADGTTWRYPSSGSFRTYGEGRCTETYIQ